MPRKTPIELEIDSSEQALKEFKEAPEPEDAENIIEHMKKILKFAYTLKANRVKWSKFKYNGPEIEEAEIRAGSFGIKDNLEIFADPDLLRDMKAGGVSILDKVLLFTFQLGYQNSIRSYLNKLQGFLVEFQGKKLDEYEKQIAELEKENKKLKRQLKSHQREKS